MKLNLERRRILVTGASGDIGSSISIALASGDAHVALHYGSKSSKKPAATEENAGSSKN